MVDLLIQFLFTYTSELLDWHVDIAKSLDSLEYSVPQRVGVLTTHVWPHPLRKGTEAGMFSFCQKEASLQPASSFPLEADLGTQKHTSQPI